jgi:hypothetical protein
MRKAVFILTALVAAGTVAQADPLKLKIGAAGGAGEVSFTLVAQTVAADTTAVVESVQVTAAVAGAMAAQDKAALVRDAVAKAEVAGTWRAVSASVGVAMSFEHFMEGTWVPVGSINNLVDTTGSGTQLRAKDQVAGFSLDLDPWSSASGFDAMGGPSFITIAVTNTLTFTRAIQPGDGPEMLVDEFQNFLVAQEAEGIMIARTSPTALAIALDASTEAVLTWQITDTGLMSLATASAVVGDVDTGRMIDR